MTPNSWYVGLRAISLSAIVFPTEITNKKPTALSGFQWEKMGSRNGSPKRCQKFQGGKHGSYQVARIPTTHFVFFNHGSSGLNSKLSTTPMQDRRILSVSFANFSWKTLKWVNTCWNETASLTLSHTIICRRKNQRLQKITKIAPIKLIPLSKWQVSVH